ncbi:hypothetical protein GCM10025881_07490 [Pseudolysinimonas kribbensis]|uniref:glycogen phosphorylase n=1 Tax=Pseudolysinimonas kribbensis TaxID=433641 RepID=A0ABQ6K4B5_9MICO|nr:hypothetical protein GCM10025881_07490 [Pseudolysinimonas kribbensis]
MDPVKAIRRFTVRTVLPEALGALDELATNLRWSWHGPTQDLFRDVAPQVWDAQGQDPIGMLGAVPPDRLEELAADEGFVGRANALRDDLHAYIREPRWYQSLGDDTPKTIAYFSPEFGIAAALPQYSGGLGILAGDHLKAASDLGVPIIGVGLFYRAGYFRQAISRDGWQEESYPVLDPDGLPMRVLRHPDGTAAQVELALPDDRTLTARIWQLEVGRVCLLLLDTDVQENDDELRGVTDRLYGGGGEHRLLQELLLGIGGARAVKTFTRLQGIPAAEVFHTNEGHAGFLGLERISDLVGDGLSFAEALQAVRAGTIFTTHTPVPAGIDRFDAALVERYFDTGLLPGLEVADVLALGAEPESMSPGAEGGTPGTFNMAVMGLRLAQRANGVSKLHGAVSRHMFGALWPGFDADDVPITSITNGVHAPTWTDPRMWRLRGDYSEGAVSDADLWALRSRLRAQLVEDARRREAAAWSEENPGLSTPTWIQRLLDPDVLTIGFARRVPTYKRLTLMLTDPERLRRLLTDPDRPVQLVIAGKSHPADDEGKRLIQRLVEFSMESDVRGRMVFLPNYDIGMAQLLYPGTDVWLNNPLRPLEACGTSGMKAALNGSLNLSILDGWWAEYFDDENGWAIPSADSAGMPRSATRSRLRRCTTSSSTRSRRASTTAARTACRRAGSPASGTPCRRSRPRSRRIAWSPSTWSGCICRRHGPRRRSRHPATRQPGARGLEAAGHRGVAAGARDARRVRRGRRDPAGGGAAARARLCGAGRAHARRRVGRAGLGACAGGRRSRRGAAPAARVRDDVRRRERLRRVDHARAPGRLRLHRARGADPPASRVSRGARPHRDPGGLTRE